MLFTPAEVPGLLTGPVKPEENDRIYDPICGPGLLLIKAFNGIPLEKARFTIKKEMVKPILFVE